MTTHFFRTAKVAGVATAIALATVAVAHAQGGLAPSPVSPTKGKSYKRGTPPTFKVRVDGDPTGVFFKVSKSKKVGDDGTLKNDIYFREMKLSGGVWQKKAEKFPALSDYFVNRPGTYYWQAYSIDCAEQDDCNVEGPISTFRIKR